MPNIKHHVIFYNYYSKLNDILEVKINKVRFSGIYGRYSNNMSDTERRLRLRKLEVEEEMEYHEKMFAINFDPSQGYKDYKESEIMDYIKIYKERVSSKIYNSNYKKETI